MENVKKNFGFGCMRLPMDGCPQHLPIRQLLQDVAREFEKA